MITFVGCQHIQVLLQRIRVLNQRLLAELLDSLPNSDFVLDCLEFHLAPIEHIFVLEVSVFIRINVVLVFAAIARLGIGLVLGQVQLGQIVFEVSVSHEGQEVKHHLLVQVVYDSEFHRVLPVIFQFNLDFVAWVVWIQLDNEWDFISVVVQINEAIVQEKSGVALAAIAVVNLLASWNVVASLDDKSLSLVAIVPGRLLWSLVVEHVGQGHEAVCLDPVDGYPKNAARYDHADFRIIFQCELRELRNLTADEVVVRFDIFNFFVDLIKEGTALEVGQFLLREENWEITKTLGQDVQILSELLFVFLPFLEDVGSQEGVLGRDEFGPHVLLVHLTANWGLVCHLQSNDLVQWHIQDDFSALDVLTGVDSSVVLRIVPELEFAEIGTSFLHPVEQSCEPLSLWVIRW